MNKITISVYRIPCDQAESDGTIEWDSTTVIVVSIQSGDEIGLGFSYGHQAAAEVIKTTLAPILQNDFLNEIPKIHDLMNQSVRNAGMPGIASHAISAVDTALWDLKAKKLKMPLCKMWGMARDCVPVYGSGGFTSYTEKETAAQFIKWKKQGIKKFKMKVGREPSKDLQRVRNARQSIGKDDDLFVDANGAYSRKEALEFAERFHEYGVSWFEEPVSSDDREGLHLLRDQTKMNIAAGEYGYTITYFKDLLVAQAVDVLQADATRCGGFTGFHQACQTGKAFCVPISSHTAPSLHLHACLSQSNVIHMEYFHDHERIEHDFFDGFPQLKNGCLKPHLNRPGHGLKLKTKEIKKYLIQEETL